MTTGQGLIVCLLVTVLGGMIGVTRETMRRRRERGWFERRGW